MKKTFLSFTVAASAILLLVLAGCSVEKTDEGEMPEVEVTKGELPEYDVKTPEVEVTTEEKTVEVPTVDVEVGSETKTVEVPSVDVTMPDDDSEGSTDDEAQDSDSGNGQG